MKLNFLLIVFMIGTFVFPLHAHRLYKKPLEFKVETASAFILQSDKPAAGKPWVWYAPTLKHHPDSSHTWYIKQLLENGISLAGCDLGEVRGSPTSNQQFTKFYEAMVKRGFSRKPVLLGQSRGGLMMLSWGSLNPDKVQAFAGIYPVCNLLSWPLKSSKKATLDDYNLSMDELIKNIKDYNPIDRLDGLAKLKVPLFMVHGDSDRVVPLKDNSAIVKSRYEKLGGPVELEMIPGKGHHVVDEIFKSQKLIEFLIREALKKT